MESNLNLSFDSDEQSSDVYEEKAFDAFMCPLTRQVMRDPVTIESGQTFEREAILKWFKECRETGRKPTCPLTQIALNSTDLTPCIALRMAIEEWRKRRAERELEKARVSLTLVSSEQNAVAGLRHVINICQRTEANKDLVRNQGLIPMIVDMLRSSNRQVRLKALEVLRVISVENDDNKEIISEGDTIRTIIKFLSNEYFQERALAVSLLYELSTLEPLCAKIGAVYGAILILVGMASSKAENIVAVEHAESTLKNLEKCEANIKPMAENGRLMPLLKKIIEGTPEVQLSMIECLSEVVLTNDAKATVASKVGPILIKIMQIGTLQAREATLKALKEISSNEASSKALLCVSESRILIDQISKQQEIIVALEEEKLRRNEEHVQLKTLIQDLQKKLQLTLSHGDEVPVAAVVVMACNRPDYLERTLQSILKYQTSVASKFPFFISQDGTNADVKNKATSFTDITFMQHIDLEPVETERPGELIAYYKIAKHYKWALDELFIKRNFSRVIIIEDDMEIAPDFFEYFEATATLLDTDKTIMAVSSWNDNGQQQFVYDPEALHRSDFFPGLGWMLTKSTWEELSPKWPKAYWDDWVRLKEVHKDRQFIHPEVCRTYNFGEHGSSMGQFFHQYLQPIRLNDVQVNWKSADLSYLKEENFRKKFAKEVSAAKPLQGSDAILKAHNMDEDVRIQYNDQRDFERIARQFGIFEEWKDGVPRTAYKGVVVFRYNKTRRRIFLIAPDSLEQLGL